MENKITFAEAATILNEKKGKIEKLIEQGDQWTKNALNGKLTKINAKLEELKQKNEEARTNKEANALSKVFNKNPELASMVQSTAQQMQESMPTDNAPQFRYGGKLPKYYDGSYTDGKPSPYQKNIDILEELPSNSSNYNTTIYDRRYEISPINVTDTRVYDRYGKSRPGYIPMQSNTELMGLNYPMGKVYSPTEQDRLNMENDIAYYSGTPKEEIVATRDKRRNSLSNLSLDNRYANEISQLSPAFYNLYRGFGKADELNTIYNPNTAESEALIRNSMNYDINPQLAANQEMAAALRQSAKTGSQGHGASYQMMVANALRNKALQDTAAYSWKQNTENQAKANAAQMLMSTGQQTQAEQQRKQIYDKQARATRDSFLQTGLGDVSRYSQMNELMKNQKDVDAIKAEALKKGMSAFFSGDMATALEYWKDLPAEEKTKAKAKSKNKNN